MDARYSGKRRQSEQHDSFMGRTWGHVAKEEEIFAAKLKEQGKPEKMIPNIVKGQVAKLLKEVCLVSQPFVKDPDVTIADLVKSKGAKIVSYSRFELGEGIEKKQENFVEEVMKQIKN